MSNYKEVRQALLNAGAKYKRNTFVFPNDAQPYIDRSMCGDKVNIKKEFQFFGTPANLADELVRMAEVNKFHKILEPSAGQGAIVDAIIRQVPSVFIDVCELMDINQNILKKHSNTHFICENFLEIPIPAYEGYYDRIIADPPFSKNQDIDHIRKMFVCLKKKEGRFLLLQNTFKHLLRKKKWHLKNGLRRLGHKLMK